MSGAVADPMAMPQAVDQDAILSTAPAPEQLSREQAGPTLIGVRPAVDVISLLGLGPQALAAALMAADQGNSLEWQRIAAEIERCDPHYLGVLNTRKRVISQLPITVEAASDSAEHEAHAEFVRAWLRRDILAPALFDMLDAIGKGWSVLEIDWHCATGDCWPKALTWRPQRWFEPAWQDGDTVRLRVEGGFADLNAAKFVVHRHRSFSALTISSGLARVAAWGFLFKSLTNQDWQQFVSTYGQPIRLGKYGKDASEEDRETLWQAVSQIAGDCAAIVPASMLIEFVQPPATADAAKLFQARCDWVDAQTSKVVLGQTATTDASPGSHAAGRTHRLVQEDIERADCALAAATINPQLVQRMIAFSFGPQAEYPRLVIGRPDEAPIAEVISAIQWAGPQGLRIKASELRERLNFSEPEAGDTDDTLVGGRAPVVVPPPQPAREGHPDGGTDVLPPSAAPPHAQATKPAPPEVEPPKVDGTGVTTLHSQLGRIVELHRAQEGPRLIEIMTAQLAQRAGPILEALTDEVRAAIDAASDMHDLKRRLDALELDPDAFAAAMQSAMAIGELAGQVSVLDQVSRGA